MDLKEMTRVLPTFLVPRLIKKVIQSNRKESRNNIRGRGGKKIEFSTISYPKRASLNYDREERKESDGGRKGEKKFMKHDDSAARRASLWSNHSSDSYHLRKRGRNKRVSRAFGDLGNNKLLGAIGMGLGRSGNGSKGIDIRVEEEMVIGKLASVEDSSSNLETLQPSLEIVAESTITEEDSIEELDKNQILEIKPPSPVANQDFIITLEDELIMPIPAFNFKTPPGSPSTAEILSTTDSSYFLACIEPNFRKSYILDPTYRGIPLAHRNNSDWIDEEQQQQVEDHAGDITIDSIVDSMASSNATPVSRSSSISSYSNHSKSENPISPRSALSTISLDSDPESESAEHSPSPSPVRRTRLFTSSNRSIKSFSFSNARSERSNSYKARPVQRTFSLPASQYESNLGAPQFSSHGVSFPEAPFYKNRFSLELQDDYQRKSRGETEEDDWEEILELEEARSNSQLTYLSEEGCLEDEDIDSRSFISTESISDASFVSARSESLYSLESITLNDEDDVFYDNEFKTRFAVFEKEKSDEAEGRRKEFKNQKLGFLRRRLSGFFSKLEKEKQPRPLSRSTSMNFSIKSRTLWRSISVSSLRSKRDLGDGRSLSRMSFNKSTLSFKSVAPSIKRARSIVSNFRFKSSTNLDEEEED